MESDLHAAPLRWPTIIIHAAVPTRLTMGLEAERTQVAELLPATNTITRVGDIRRRRTMERHGPRQATAVIVMTGRRIALIILAEAATEATTTVVTPAAAEVQGRADRRLLHHHQVATAVRGEVDNPISKPDLT